MEVWFGIDLGVMDCTACIEHEGFTAHVLMDLHDVFEKFLAVAILLVSGGGAHVPYSDSVLKNHGGDEGDHFVLFE